MEQVFRFFTSYLTFLGARLLRIPEIVQGRAKKIPPKIKHIIWNKHLLNSPKLFLSPHAPKHNNQPPKKSPLDINPNLIQSLPPPPKNSQHHAPTPQYQTPQGCATHSIPPNCLMSALPILFFRSVHVICNSGLHRPRKLEAPNCFSSLFFSRRPLVGS